MSTLLPSKARESSASFLSRIRHCDARRDLPHTASVRAYIRKRKAPKGLRSAKKRAQSPVPFLRFATPSSAHAHTHLLPHLLLLLLSRHDLGADQVERFSQGRMIACYLIGRAEERGQVAL